MNSCSVGHHTVYLSAGSPSNDHVGPRVVNLARQRHELDVAGDHFRQHGDHIVAIPTSVLAGALNEDDLGCVSGGSARVRLERKRKVIMPWCVCVSTMSNTKPRSVAASSLLCPQASRAAGSEQPQRVVKTRASCDAQQQQPRLAFRTLYWRLCLGTWCIQPLRCGHSLACTLSTSCLRTWSNMMGAAQL